MKTKLSLIPALLLAFSLALTGCNTRGAAATAAPTQTPAAMATPTAAPTPAPTETPEPEDIPALSLTAAKDYAELYAALTANRNSYGMGSSASRAATADAAEEEAAMDAPMEAPAAVNTGASGGDGGWSGTNVQVQGIDEGDIVKTDGEYIYVLNRGPASEEGNRDYRLTIVRADGADSAVVSSTAVGWYRWESNDDNLRVAAEDSYYYSENKRPTEMFVANGTAVILSNYYSDRGWYEGDEWNWEDEQYLCVDFYDVSDPENPALTAALGQDGSLTGSRLLDGRLYIVSTYWVWNYDEDDVHTYVPALYRNGAAETIAADCIYICGGGTEYVVACAYDFAGAALTDAQSLLGSGDEIYMSGSSLYVLGSEWTNEVVDTRSESVYTVTEHVNSAATRIFRFDLSDGLSLAADGGVPGSVDSQFSADEKDGYLRIVTTYDSSRYTIYEDEAMGFTNYRWPDEQEKSSNGLYVLDLDLNPVGSLTGLAEEEYVYSVRFDDDIAYFCTYRQVDPLFTVDLSDPANPAVMSALKISGFSEYLHNWTADRLFGFGQEADEDSGRTEGLKLVMFDTSNKADVTVAHTYALEDVWYSEALYNHKAFFIDPLMNIIGFVGNDSDYFIFSYDDETGFTEKCRFTFDTYEYNVRGLWIGDNAYVVGQEQMMTVDMDTWANIAGVDIAG